MMKVEDILEILSIPLLGIIPESTAVLKASNVGTPVVFDAKSNAGKAYEDAVSRLDRRADRDEDPAGAARPVPAPAAQDGLTC